MNPMAATQPTAQAVPAFVLAPHARRSIDANGNARPSAARVAPKAEGTAGMLIARPDLSDEAVVAAIAERMTFEGRDASKAGVILKAALAGRPVAAAFVRRLVLPAPKSPLSMPIQSILRNPAEASSSRTPWFRRLSLGR